MSMCMHDFILERCNCSTSQLADYRHHKAKYKAPGVPQLLCKDIREDKECLEKLAPEMTAEKAGRV